MAILSLFSAPETFPGGAGAGSGAGWSSAALPTSASSRSPLVRQMLWSTVQQTMTSGTNLTSTSRAFKKMDRHRVFSIPKDLSTTHLAFDRQQLERAWRWLRTGCLKGVMRQMGWDRQG